MRIVLDTAILVRGHGGAKGLARDLLIGIVESDHILRSPTRCSTNPLLGTPIRDVNDAVVMQTAVIGEADILCTKDRDFFEPPAEEFLKKAGIAVLDDVSLMCQLHS